MARSGRASVKIIEQNILALYGKRGKIWLSDLPELIDQIATKYHLSHLKPVQNLSYNYVLSGFQNEKPIILKLGLDVDALYREAKALKHYRDHGAVKLIVESEGMLLLEQAIPGCNLKSYFPSKEEESIQVFCELMKRLHAAPIPEKNFPDIKDWLKVLDESWNIPETYLQKARKLRNQLLATSKKSCFLHGDLHHENILQRYSDWVSIDPKGVIGEPTFEVAIFIRNPISELLASPNIENLIQNRMIKIAKFLNVEVKRILAWCFVESVLGWIWQLEDNLDPSYFSRLVDMFYNSLEAPPAGELSCTDTGC